MDIKKTPVLIAGIGGASLGTEILKSLLITDSYEVYGCDISEFAFGHYLHGFIKTFLIENSRYVESILEICDNYHIKAVIPGGEGPLRMLGSAINRFKDIGVVLAINSPLIVQICSDKARQFEFLRDRNIPIPWTISINDIHDLKTLEIISYPCVIKPACDSGGSRFVFLVANRDEVDIYVNYILKNSGKVIVQQYIPIDEGEFTIGVLSLPHGEILYTVVMQRLFNAKLSVQMNSKLGLISSGYSQGLIDEFPNLRLQAENIAQVLCSTGSINIQARVLNGILLPFEINPRFSASTYLRTMAGFNEVDTYLKFSLFGIVSKTPEIKAGYYFRSLDQIYIPKGFLKQ